ncbi:hypothetical protein [Paracoccus sp. 08]|uniref:hypothetical protein n=1 Tax=Paracoccus sp. 08 TaxID=2606624 RepID=UPI0020962636|nr:hypothetical protein [Paracoccus sp. 08]
MLRARDQFVQQLAAYDRIGQFDAVTIMHGAGSDSPTYAADLRALVTKLGEAGARQINVMVPCGTSQRGDFASTQATIEAFRDRGVAPMRLVAPLYACPRSGLVNPTPEAVTMLAELDALCAADPSWLPPMAFLARRTGNIIDVDFEVMAGFSLLPSAPVTLGLTYSGAAITTAGVVDDPLTGLMTRLRITLTTAAAGTLRYAFGPAAADGNMRDNWSVMSRTGQPLYRHALPFQFEVS